MTGSRRSPGGRRVNAAAGLLLLLGVSCLARAEDGPVAEILNAAPGKDYSSLKHLAEADYGLQLGQFGKLVEVCRADARQCNPRAVPQDQVVDAAGREGYTVRFEWLRTALDQGADLKDKDRVAKLDAAAQRLTEDAAELQHGVAEPAELKDIPAARKQADAILHQPEFQRVSGNPWLQTRLAMLGLFFDRLFSGIGEMIPHAPWLAAAIEWGLLALAAAAVMLWVWRQSRQQRVAIASGGPANVAQWQKESDNWAERAREEAARGEWREAVHSLYWSAIVMLEGQKLWRQNRARTPREYLLLLEPGSERQTALRGLTRVFERIWYGLRPAAEQDYRQATSLLDQLRAR